MPSFVPEEPIIPEAEMERLSRIGHALYEEKLKPILEPERNGQEVAIHLDTGDYEVAPRRSRPHFALRRRHPEGGLILRMEVGPPRPDDMLTLRIMAGKIPAESQK